MASEYELSPPELLVGGYYSEVPEPRLSQPYNLTATYDDRAGDDTKYTGPEGIDALALGEISLTFARIIQTNSFDSSAYGQAKAENTASLISLTSRGIQGLSFGVHSSYNLLQFLKPQGKDQQDFGVQFVQGGVKEITHTSKSELALGRPEVVNTTADQHVTGVSAGSILAFGHADVQPYTIWYVGFNALETGNGWIQHSPIPKGFDSGVIGAHSIEFSLKYLEPVSIDLIEPVGNPRVRDRATKLYHQSEQQVTTVFGDTRARLANARINPLGESFAEVSEWSTVASTRRYYEIKGFENLYFGDASIANTIPSLFVEPIESLEHGQQFIAYATRNVYLRESQSYLGVGVAKIEQTPSIAPKGFESDYGNAWVSLKIREIGLEGKGTQLDEFGSEAWIDYRQRPITIKDGEGPVFTGYGIPELTHDVRFIEAKGRSDHKLGLSWVSDYTRSLQPESIPNIAVSITHSISGPKTLRPVGFEATQWLTRIIPHSTTAYLQGFSNRFDYGEARVENYKNHIKPLPFSTDSSLGNRWGYTELWNLRQVVTQEFDAQDGLNPPEIGRWNAIENRSKEAPMNGTDMQRFGRAQFLYGARLIEPRGNNHLTVNDKLTVTHWQREVAPEPLDSLVIPRWAVAFNIADLVHATGFDAFQSSHTNSLENLSRKYQRVGAYETAQYGVPFIADGVRNIVPRELHAIQPPRIDLPTVHLNTRYIDDANVGNGLGIGLPFARIHWNRITTRWSFNAALFVGEPTLKNLTPEYRAYGHNSEEYGQARLRTEWREVEQNGDSAQSFGQLIIRDRTSWILQNKSAQYMVFGQLRMERVGGIPDEQTVITMGNDFDLFGKHFVGAQECLLEGIAPPKIEGPFIYANSIRVEPGFWREAYGELEIYNKNQQIIVDEFQDPPELPKPMLSPHLIFAPNERPEGFLPPENAHYVDHDAQGRSLKGVGRDIAVGHKNRMVKADGVDAPDSHRDGRPIPDVRNTKFLVEAKSLQSLRFGFPEMLPHDIEAEQMEASDTMVVGNQDIRLAPYTGPQEVLPRSLSTLGFGMTRVELFNRAVSISGFECLEVGSLVENDKPYMWQGLRIGELMPTIPIGFTADEYSDAWISHKVRELVSVGFDGSGQGYDFDGFDQRMRVHIPSETIPPSLISVGGFNPLYFGTPDIKNHAHYIRPDGNAEQYRKGVQHV